ncbi:hypothetical protein GC163_05415 [bacterium]|nr:hypothetical protein [bacterium]
MSATLLDQVIEPVSECLTQASARKIVDLRATPDMQARVDYLATQANQGGLTDEERSEYDRYLAAFHLVTLLQIEARKLLDESAA